MANSLLKNRQKRNTGVLHYVQDDGFRGGRIRNDGVEGLAVGAGVGEVEGFVDEGEVGDDVAEDGVFEQRPVLPGGVVGVAVADGPVGAGFERDEDGAAPGFDEADAEASGGGDGDRHGDGG